MSDLVPVSLLLTRRALCPGCGAALQLELGRNEVVCRFCASVSYVERRLRTVEAELRKGLEPSQIEHRTRFIPAHSIGANDLAETACPGCGAPIEIRNDQDTTTCAQCGSSAKVERRLVAGMAEDWSAFGDDADLEAFAARDPIDLSPEYPKGIGRWEQEAQDKWNDELNDDRIRTLLTATDPDRQFRAADSFQGWRQINPWRERTLARLMNFCCDASPELQICITTEVIEPMVFGNNTSPAIKHALFRAAGRALFRSGLSRPLMQKLGLAWDGATLKLMLELAEYQLKQDRPRDAEHALDGAYMAMRDYGMRFEIGEVMLYRLLYLEVPILAWVIQGSIHSWQIDDYWRIVQLVDDCAFERPELAPLIRDMLGAPMKPTSFAEYRALLDRIDKLLSPLAQEFALDKYCWYPDSSNDDPGMDELAYCLQWLHPRLADPLFHKTVRKQIERFIGQLERQDLPPLDAYIGMHGESLPPHIRYRYLQRRPETTLLKKFYPGNLYESDQRDPTPLQKELDTRKDRFSELHRELDREHKANRMLFDAWRTRINEEDNAASALRHKERERERQAEFERNSKQSKAHEDEQMRRGQEIERNQREWAKSSRDNIKQQIAEYKRKYKETGETHWLELAKTTKQALKLYRGDGWLRWRQRFLRRLMFWR